MKKNGLFVVFEGADGVGKSSVSEFAKEHFEKAGLDVINPSFPGKEEKTLGELVYDIHHNQENHFTRTLTNEALQTLHIAAHIECIKNVIAPALESGKCVLLDRYWWSTYVYGIVAGVNIDVLGSLCDIDKAMFADILPDRIFLITRDSSLKNDLQEDIWQKVNNEYLDLAKREQKKSDAVSIVYNEDFNETSETIRDEIKLLLG